MVVGRTSCTKQRGASLLLIVVNAAWLIYLFRWLGSGHHHIDHLPEHHSGAREVIGEVQLRDVGPIIQPTWPPTPLVVRGTYFAMCVVVKDQNHDIREWIQYHHWLGAVKFYVYDHNSSTPLLEDLKDYIKAGIVEYTLFAGHHDPSPPKMFRKTGQGYAYADCLARSRNRHQWLSFIDADEFLVLYDPAHRNISDFLRDYEDHGAVGVNWRMFGSSGLKTKPAVSTLEAYTACVPANHSENTHIKTLVNVMYTASIGETPHHFWFVKGKGAVNENHAPCTLSWCKPQSHQKIGLHHYVTKSLAEYEEKMVRGGGSGSLKGMNFFQLVDQWSTDTCLQATQLGKACCA
jgi:hypothetical protein